MQTLYKELLEVQKELTTFKKDTAGFNYKYVTLDTILEVIRPLLNKHGLILMQLVGCKEADSKVISTLTTVILHAETGDKVETTMQLHPQKTDKISPMQALGSSITYAKRYQLSALLSISTEEDTDDTPQIKSSKVPKKIPAGEDIF